MQLRTIITSAILFGTIGGLAIAPGIAQQAPPTLAPAKESGADVRQFSDAVYHGYRASRLLGSAVFSLKGEYLGTVRNMAMADTGQITSLLVEGAETTDTPEFISRIPWTRMVRPLHSGALIADFSDLRSREFGLFFDPDQQRAGSHEFTVSKIIGDYARLQSGYGYGYVSDLVFDQGGKLIAIVVSREASAGGGTYAFPYPGTTGRWSPEMSYYGLPYVTADQASQAGIRIDMHRFQQS